MTIATVGRRFTYAGNGVTTAFSFPRLLLANTDIVVYLTDATTDVAVLQTLITHYSVSGMGDPAGVTVTFVTPPITGKTVVLIGAVPKTQDYDPTDAGFVTALGTEDALDKLALTIQELSDLMARTIQLAPGSTYGGSLTLPKPVANYVLGFAGDALSLIATPLLAGPQGNPGIDGRTILSGVGVPAGGLGANGDFYIDTAASSLYGPKTAGVWGAGVSLIGPAGEITGPATSANDTLPLFSGNKVLKNSAGTGFPQLAAGVVSSYAAVPAGVLVGTTASQTLTNKTLTSPVINTPTGIVKGDVGLGNVDNTSDVNKPVSTAQAAADALKANIASPTFTGKVTTAASAAGGAGFNLPAGADPSSPVNGDLWSDGTSLSYRMAGVTLRAMPKQGGTFTGLVVTVASATGGAGFRLPHGAAPTSPVDGDFWSTTTAFFGRINGSTVTLSVVGHTHAESDVTNLVSDLALKAPLASPALTGDPTAPTASPGDNDTSIATTAFVTAAIAAGGGGGGRALLSTQTASASAQIDFVLTTWLSTYDRFEIDIEDLLPATNNTALWLRTSTNAGSSYDSAASSYGWTHMRSKVGSVDNQSASTDVKIVLANNDTNNGLSNVAGETLAGRVTVHTPSVAQKCKVAWETAHFTDDTAALIARCVGAGLRLAAADVDAIRFMMSSGNITSGVFRLYGISK